MPKTVRVRIAVVTWLEDDGPAWMAHGFRGGDMGEEFARDCAADCHDGVAHKVVWIEADVPLPDEPVVRGEVVS